MNREIKFRVWCSKERMMYAYAEVGLNGLNFWELIDMSQYNVMQYTGLKDKNGIEIYDGDIYEELVEKGWLDKSLNKMVYKKHLVKMVVKMQINYCEEYGDIYGYPMDLEKREILGNIYENPEILESDKNE